MILAELNVWHSRPAVPTRRVALGEDQLGFDPSPGPGGLLIAAVFAASASNGIPMPNIPEMGSVWGPMADALLVIRDQAYGTNEETGVTISNASDAMKLAAEQVRAAIAGG